MAKKIHECNKTGSKCTLAGAGGVCLVGPGDCTRVAEDDQAWMEPEAELDFSDEEDEETNASNHGCCIGPCEQCPGAKSCTGWFDK